MFSAQMLLKQAGLTLILLALEVVAEVYSGENKHGMLKMHEVKEIMPEEWIGT